MRHSFPTPTTGMKWVCSNLHSFAAQVASRGSNHVALHLKKPPTSMGPDPTMDYVRRAMWGMMYADDVCIVLRSSQGLAKIMEAIVEVCRAFALIVSTKKTETMPMPATRKLRTMA